MLFLTSPVGVTGMSKTWWLAVAVESNLGLLILLVVHVCASTIWVFEDDNKDSNFELKDSTFFFGFSSLSKNQKMRNRDSQRARKESFFFSLCFLCGWLMISERKPLSVPPLFYFLFASLLSFSAWLTSLGC